MWPGLAPAPLGTPACELRASAAPQAALKLQGGLACKFPDRSWESRVHEVAAPPAGHGLPLHLPLHCQCFTFNKNFKWEGNPKKREYMYMYS